MKNTQMNTDKYSHKLLLLIPTMINLLADRGCNGKRKCILFFDTALFSYFFPMVLCSLQEISESTLTPPLS